jgi:hypothetical protein
VWLA